MAQWDCGKDLGFSGPLDTSQVQSESQTVSLEGMRKEREFRAMSIQAFIQLVEVLLEVTSTPLNEVEVSTGPAILGLVDTV